MNDTVNRGKKGAVQPTGLAVSASAAKGFLERAHRLRCDTSSGTFPEVSDSRQTFQEEKLTLSGTSVTARALLT